MTKLGHCEDFRVGDLVMFSTEHSLGLVVAIESATGFGIEENVKDIYVLWSSGECFWCLDCTLTLVSREIKIK